MFQRADVQPGVLVGGYRLIARISSAGMTNVWLAEVNETGRKKLLVLKTVRPRCAEDALLVKTFLAEASVAAQLAHPNVIEVIDFGEVAGRYFLATELLAGRTLKQIGSRARSSQQVVDLWFLLRVAIDVCAALSYIHAFDGGRGASLVRLDVRPENIMVAFNGLVKLLDPAIIAGNAETGKCGYAAPERVESSESRPTSDIYALGRVLYEQATGVLPLKGVAPSVHNPAVDPLLSGIILRSIAPDPSDRYQSAGAFGRDLRDYLAQVGPERLDHPLEAYVFELFPGESHARKEASAPPSFRGRVASLKTPAPPSIPPVVEPTNGRRATLPPILASQANGARRVTSPPAQRSSTPPPDPTVDDSFPIVWEEPKTEPSPSAKALEPVASSPPFVRLVPSSEVDAPRSKDLFAARRAMRPQLAFSMTLRAPRQNDVSPRAGSVFSNRENAPPCPMLSPEAQRALEAFDRGLDLVGHKDHERALEAWREAVSLDPTNRTIQANLRRLERLVASAVAV